MTVELVQIVRCDRCGATQYQPCCSDSERPIPPAQWLILNWQAGPYEFSFCPGCASAFVDFAAQSHAPSRLHLVGSKEAPP